MKQVSSNHIFKCCHLQFCISIINIRYKCIIIGEILFFVWGIIIKKKKKCEKRLKVHPLVTRRNLKSVFFTMFSDLREDEKNFQNHFWMSIKSFYELLCKLDLKCLNCVRVPISLGEKLCNIKAKYLFLIQIILVRSFVLIKKWLIFNDFIGA